ncbi:MAG: queuosine biosynthesis protein QueC [bacterium]|nr:MAG: queuosine biosynthesis protein QueC [bacterium]KAF0149178.1 MAG: queuosine biosynthesis protein QueC [bacterium]KAF0168815.1 MAG: queuosine biosynthesis protein QueC [bacterium]TXT20905.1 MAG: queuosine biosynthesis protein QueC [bacterium]
MRPRAVVLLSGGLDSATTLAIARRDDYDCHALSLDYGQRHHAELDAARTVAAQLGAVEHRIMRLDMGPYTGSALTDPGIAVPETSAPGIPVTYVPARNTIMLALALGWAEVLDAEAIHIGVNALDYSGYPDCRPAFIDAFQNLADVATRRAVEGRRIEIRAPLIHLSKAQIIRLGAGLGVDYGLTVSCYQASASGLACGRCDSCRLRRQGFEQAGIPDPTRYLV